LMNRGGYFFKQLPFTRSAVNHQKKSNEPKKKKGWERRSMNQKIWWGRGVKGEGGNKKKKYMGP